MQTQKLPIGYWIKQADNLLTEKISAIQSEFGLTRTGWQILNSIHENGSMDKSALLDLMQPFSSQEQTERIVSTFQVEHILELHDQTLTLTSKGKEVFDSCFQKQREFRAKAMDTISEEDYRTTVLTLQKIVANIDA